eukprot:CAMPEP_0173421828 /NCGR_PEP_ID=MMETSP1357-20121228/2785_1 /TAXON_ID=77926 /ORGANISM="Hemiselmis rufescens, Strain PCC563" /LENGTH=262 /DNA_ID=CAMNT_0014384785 /DNA_START=35 /DNA_END=819 /DNA_ORIENTATION=+
MLRLLALLCVVSASQALDLRVSSISARMGRREGFAAGMRRMRVQLEADRLLSTPRKTSPREVQRLRGGEGVPLAKPPTWHMVLMGVVCGSVLVLNEMKMLSVVMRVLLTLALSVVFLLLGVNKSPSGAIHKPMHDFYAGIFPDIANKVWKPTVEGVLNAVGGAVASVLPQVATKEGLFGEAKDGVFPLAKAVAASITPSNLMAAVGRVEVGCATLMLVSLAGMGSRGHRVPLAEAANAVLLVLMGAFVYSHRVLQDGLYIVP